MDTKTLLRRLRNNLGDRVHGIAGCGGCFREEMDEAADLIEQLTKQAPIERSKGQYNPAPDVWGNANLIAAAPEMLEAILTTQCPRPANSVPADVTYHPVSECLRLGNCGCDLGAAVRKATGS